MNHPWPSSYHRDCDRLVTSSYGDPGLRKFADRLHQSMQRDAVIQNTTDSLREFLQVDRVVLYYFHSQWQGQVTFESISYEEFSIFGLTGAEQCFSSKYASLYETGRISAIANVETDIVNSYYKEFLQSIEVRANLVVPILHVNKLWGLLICHHCQSARSWLQVDIEIIQKAAKIIEAATSNRK